MTVRLSTADKVKERFDESVFRCFHCRNVLGVCTSETLIIGMARFNRAVTIECNGCRKTSRWGPSVDEAKSTNAGA